MDIGTAKPSKKILSKIPHHLIDIIDASESYSAGNFVKDVDILINKILSRGRMPILVGGTHLYLKAARDGLADLPPANKKIRENLDNEASKIGWPRLHNLLKEVDPVAASRISINDRQRIQRALEVYYISGEPISSLQKKKINKKRPNINTIAIFPKSKDWLDTRIDERLDGMINNGFIEEVQYFKGRSDMHADLPSMRSVGYRQLWSYLDGNFSLDEVRKKIAIATRNLAKRQMTSLRSDHKIFQVVFNDQNDESYCLANLAKEIITNLSSQKSK